MPSRNEGAGTLGAPPGIGDNGAATPGRARVGEIQRARLRAAMVDVASRRGFPDATVARVVACAGVSRRTFYELFEDREECFLAAWDDAIATASSRVEVAYASGNGWSRQIRLALTALLTFLDTDPDLGRLLVVESLGAGPKALERRALVLAQAAAAVDRGRDERKAGPVSQPLTAEGIVGAVFSIVHARMIERQRRSLVELTNPLMSMIVLPYLGPAAARAELERAVPKAPIRSRRSTDDPLREIEMRLTYRTVRVLLAIGSRPGASNKEVGERSGALDQGQISRLLSRLERLGLIHNTGAGPTKGAPNAWALTEKGSALERAMNEESSPGGRP
jgi:AcrR family transcriptional regulator/DNA-binding MarR family transcriptional regulator